MADLSKISLPVNDIETQSDAPVSEALMQKFGGDVNFAVAKQMKFQEFNANGTFSVPLDVSVVHIWGIGGGGGGSVSSAAGGGSGIFGSRSVAVTPGANVSVVIGGGGGQGASGGQTSFGSVVFPGGEYGQPNVSGGGLASGGRGSSPGGPSVSGLSAPNVGFGGSGRSLGPSTGSAGANTGSGGAGNGNGGSGYLCVTYVTGF